jgi:hypothetical protein
MGLVLTAGPFPWPLSADALVDGEAGGLVGGGVVGASVVRVMMLSFCTTPLGLIPVTMAVGSDDPCTCTCNPLRCSEFRAEERVRPR